jgi:hypothetical protein
MNRKFDLRRIMRVIDKNAFSLDVVAKPDNWSVHAKRWQCIQILIAQPFLV